MGQLWPLLVDSDGCGFPSTTEHPDLEEERADYPQEEDHFLLLAAPSCFGLPGVPWARRGLVSPGSWVLWVPSALSQPLGTPFTIPGGWNYSLRSREKQSKPKMLAMPQGPRIGSWNLRYLEHPFLGHLPLPASKLGTNSANGFPFPSEEPPQGFLPLFSSSVIKK